MKNENPHRRCALLTVSGILDRCKGRPDEFVRAFLCNLENRLMVRPCRHADWHPRNCPRDKSVWKVKGAPGDDQSAELETENNTLRKEVTSLRALAARMADSFRIMINDKRTPPIYDFDAIQSFFQAFRMEAKGALAEYEKYEPK